jgi:hypothetical protein
VRPAVALPCHAWVPPSQRRARATGAETPGRFAGRPRAAAPAEPIRDSGLRQQGRIGKNPRGERGQADADVSVGNFEKRGKGRALGRVPVVLGTATTTTRVFFTDRFPVTAGLR